MSQEAGDATRSQRPTPGRRPPREIWTGEEGRQLTEPEFESVPNLDPGGHRPKFRLTGIDAARGFALAGMFAVHLFPAYNPSENRATLVWMIFAGTAFSLFGVLAGAGLAFTTGGATRYRGRRLVQAHVKIVLRAVALIAIGLAINMAPLMTFNILIYIAAMMVLAIPLTVLRVRPLLVVTAVFVLALPFVRYVLHTWVAGSGYYPNPQFGDVLHDPLGVLTTVTITGIYPAITMLPLCSLGIAIGRIVLKWQQAPLTLMAVGTVVYLLTRSVSWILERGSWGYQQIRDAFPGATEDQIEDFIVFGPTGELPTGSFGWFLTAGPHTETPFAVATGCSAALIAIGFFVLAARRFHRLLRPLAEMGKLSATVYFAHLLLMAYAPDDISVAGFFVAQLVGAVLFSYAWLSILRQGPVERVITIFVNLSSWLIPLRKEAPK